MSEAVLMSKEGHFLPLEEGVKYLPNPLIFASYLLKRKKMRIFASFPLLFSVVRILYIHIYINTPFNRCRRWYNDILVSCVFLYKTTKTPYKRTQTHIPVIWYIWGSYLQILKEIRVNWAPNIPFLIVFSTYLYYIWYLFW